MKQFLKNFSFYLGPEILGSLMPLVTLPITSRYFGLTEFGVIALFGLCQVPFSILTEYGIAYILPGFWFKMNEKRRKELLFACVAFAAGLGLLSAGIITLFYSLIFNWLAGSSIGVIDQLYPWLIILVLSNLVQPIFSQWIILNEKADIYAKIKSAELILKAVVMVILVVWTRDVIWVLIGSVVISGGLNLIKFVLLLPSLRLTLNRFYYLTIFKIGYPIFLRSCLNQCRKNIDKVLVSALYPIETLALYNWSVQFYSIYSRVDAHFIKVVVPDFYKGLSKRRLDFKKYDRLFFGWFSFIALGLVVFYFVGIPLIAYVSNGVYTSAYPYIMAIGAVVTLESLMVAFGQPLIFYRKTKHILYSTVISGAVNIGLALLLVPRLGLYGGIISLGSVPIVLMIYYGWVDYQHTNHLFLKKRSVAYYGLVFGVVLSYTLQIGYGGQIVMGAVGVALIIELAIAMRIISAQSFFKVGKMIRFLK